ncbi:MAG: Gfo/Idh/MocA family oxidoreductase [Caulobacteraceae bacterium]
MTLRIGLLGASRIAPRAIITPARRRGDVAITAVAARDIDKAKAFATEHHIAALADSYEALVARDDVDLVYCALPPAAHLQPCLAALANGKALLVEKPFAMNRDDAIRIAQAATRSGRPAMEAFHYRFHSQFLRAQQLLRNGAIGAIRQADGLFEAKIVQGPGELRWTPALGGGGVMDLGCYVLHALRTLIGAEPTLRNAHAELLYGVDASMDARLAFPGEVEARLRCSMLGPRRDHIVLKGDAGELRITGFVSPQNGGRLTLTSVRDSFEEAASGPPSYDAQLAHVVKVMAGEVEPLTGGADAVANMAVIDAMRASVGLEANIAA